ncbi:MotA/TolQ/ExbB proton channel family protein [Candidatus Pelagibacter bacterium nBUS_25]|uniref:MotA/TolQ/ExbB proton channel family protein n=1 Tax=Candidatus Pelagibacter bacterium nBUS_25 TaxID=3374187 RepID=UPI003EB9B345
MAKNEVSSIKLRRTSAGNLRNFFFFFTIIGIASIFFVRTFSSGDLIFQMVVPGLVVILYSILIFQKGKNVLSQDQLGDSVYYLGFILTLWALILALYDLSSDPKAEDIISKFAIALVTTVVGIFVRVFMSQFAPAQEDINEMSEKMLSDTALNLKTQLDVTITTFTGLIDELSRKTSETLEKNSLELSAFLKENSEEFSKSSKKIINNLNSASDALIEKSSSLDKTLESLNTTTESFNENLSTLNSALTQNNPAREISNLQDVFDNMTKSMEAYKDIVSSDIKEISSNKKEIFKSLEESREALQKMYTNMSNMSDLIVSKLKRK